MPISFDHKNNTIILADGGLNELAANKTGILTIDTTGALLIPLGTTGERPGTPVEGHFRYNVTTEALEFYQTTAADWLTVSTVGDEDQSVVLSIFYGS